MDRKYGLFLEDTVFVNFIGRDVWEMWDGTTSNWRKWQGSKIEGNIEPNPKEELVLPEEYLT